MTNLIGTGEIVGFVELPRDYPYDFYSFSNKIAGFSITVQQPPYLLVPHGGWSGAERSLVQKIKPVRVFNKPL